MIKYASLALAVAVSCNSFAAETCKSGRGIPTAYGRLVSTDCFDAAGHLTHQSISLDGTKLVEDRRLFDDYAIDKSRTHWIYSGEPQWETGCPDRLYLIDISKKPARVIAFGVKKACNEFHWASWGKKRSVIALKNNVKFVYEDGVMTLPKAGESLWNAIEPPHAGPGLSEEDAVPFAVDVPLPK
jgi:hypothetical protein